MTTVQTINLRAIKGLVIANTKYQIKKIAEMAYIVKSQSSPKKYAVINVSGDWHCECPDHTYRHAICKHIFAVQDFIENHSEASANQHFKGCNNTPKP